MYHRGCWKLWKPALHLPRHCKSPNLQLPPSRQYAARRHFPRPTDEAAPGYRLVVQLPRERARTPPSFYAFLPDQGCRADGARFNKDIADLLESCDNLAGCAA